MLVYDDLSTDGTPALLARHADRLRVIRGTRRGSFAANMNRLAEQAVGRRLVLINNDVLLRPRWLEPMLELAHAEEAAIVGNLQVYPDSGRINHAGGCFDRGVVIRHLYEGLAPDLPAARRRRRLQFVTAACWLVDADWFRRLGGFDEAYVNGYEDADFCLRTLEAGGSVWYCGASVIEHYGNSTPGRFDAHGGNRAYFLARWRERIEIDLPRLTTEDGVDWPHFSRGYRMVEAIWRYPPVNALGRRLMRLPGLMRARQALRARLLR